MYVCCALYKFVALEDYVALRAPLLELMLSRDIRGTLLLAAEGINGTVSGTRSAIDALIAHLNSDPRIAPIRVKESLDDTQAFHRTKVKLKKEIVTLGVEGIDPLHTVGTYVQPSEWNALISDPEVVLIDTRNDYEIDIGKFRDAVDPNTKTFRGFPQFIKDNLDPARNKKIAMYCTGGIRCEKGTAYLKQQGFEQVYHLEGGILKYLEEIPPESSLWQGDCYVFDNRVAVDHSLSRSEWVQCHACRWPVNPQGTLSEHYEQGVSCARCHGTHSEERLARFRERQRQINLAEARGEHAVGDQARQAIKSRSKQKVVQ